MKSVTYDAIYTIFTPNEFSRVYDISVKDNDLREELQSKHSPSLSDLAELKKLEYLKYVDKIFIYSSYSEPMKRLDKLEVKDYYVSCMKAVINNQFCPDIVKETFKTGIIRLNSNMAFEWEFTQYGKEPIGIRGLR